MKISEACSLGECCHSSYLLKRLKYKLCSYPFDWIISDYNNIIHCIKDEFKFFLDKSYYISLSDKECRHTHYNINNSTFNHRNPLINIDHYNYYIRCVDRFKDLLKKPTHKLFTTIFINLDSKDINMNTIIDFNNKFKKYTQNYTLLVILHIPNKDKNYHLFTYNDNIHFLELHTLSISRGLEFVDENDNVYLDTILKSTYTL